MLQIWVITNYERNIYIPLTRRVFFLHIKQTMRHLRDKYRHAWFGI